MQPDNLTEKNVGYGYEEICHRLDPHKDEFSAMDYLSDGYYSFLPSPLPDPGLRFLLDRLADAGFAANVLERDETIRDIATQVLQRYVGPYDIMYDGSGGVSVSPGSYLGCSAEVRYKYGRSEKVDLVAPDQFEVFTYDHDSCEEAFQRSMRVDIHDMEAIKEQMEEHSFDVAEALVDILLDQDTGEVLDWLVPLWREFAPYGNDHGDAFSGEFGRLSILVWWLTIVWLKSPLPGAEEYKRKNISIFDECFVSGKKGCIVTAVHGLVAADHFTLVKKEPLTCAYCGEPSWCVEHTMVFKSAALICEACLQEGLPKVAGVTCGTKFCAESRCKHHPFNHLGAAGMLHTLRNHGLLSSGRQGNPLLQGGNQWKQLST
jgi:hypothetical protein